MNTLSNDLGNGATKTASKGKVSVFPNHIAVPDGGNQFDGAFGQSQSVQVLEHDGGIFFVGLGAYSKGAPLGDITDHRILSGTDGMKATLYAAWANHFQSPAKTKGPHRLYVQLPVSMMMQSNRASNQKAIEEWLVGKHEWEIQDQRYTLTIESVAAISQAGGAIYDQVLDKSGKPSDSAAALFDGNTAVISVGRKTTELMYFIDGVQQDRMTFSEQVGVHELLQMIDVDGEGLQIIDTKLRNGNKRITQRADEYMSKWASVIHSRIAERWVRIAGTVDNCLMVGGGFIIGSNGNRLASYLRPIFQSNSDREPAKTLIPSNPVTSIVEGGLKKGLYDGTTQEEG